MKSPIAVAVGAGRFDADNDAITARCERAMESRSLYLSTEVMHDQRNAFTAPGCKALFISEFAALYDPKVWRPKGRTRLNWLTRKVTFSRGRIRIRPRQMTVLMEHLPTGKVGYFDVNHLPAHIQHGETFVDDESHADEVLAHKRATSHAGRRINRRKRRHPDRFQVWCGDVNLDLHVARWRSYMVVRLGLTPVWRENHLPPTGDMGRRLITGAWTYGINDTEGVLLASSPAERGLDHRLTAFSGRLALP